MDSICGTLVALGARDAPTVFSIEPACPVMQHAFTGDQAPGTEEE
jgi:hypothetical protein